MLQELQGAFEVNLIFVEASRLRSVGKAPLDSQNVLVTSFWIIYVLFEVLEELRKGHFAGFATHVVVQSWLEQVGELLWVLRLLKHHVDAA